MQIFFVRFLSSSWCRNSVPTFIAVACSLNSFFFSVSSGQNIHNKATSKSKDILLSFSNGRNVTRQEFEQVFRKNASITKTALNPKNNLSDKEQIDNYLNLYINFHRKVMEAERLGLDTLPNFKEELAGYVTQLSQTYLYEREVLNQLIEEAYKRSQYEVRASHILLSVLPNASAIDTQKAYTKILSIRDSIIKGVRTFAEMANKYSDDAEGRKLGGDLGFFSALDMVYPFETGAFTTPVGQVSMPIRTQFGYHLIWVRDKIPYQGNRKASHIVVLHTNESGVKDTAASYQKIESIYAKLVKGEDFETLARNFSQDPNSANLGGDLGTNRLLPVLEEAKKMLNLNEFSKPIYTPFGWHIIKVTGLYPIQSYEASRLQLKNRIIKDSRVRMAEEKLVEELKLKYHFKPNFETENAFMNSFEELKNKSAQHWLTIIPEPLQKQFLFSFADQNITLNSFLQYCSNKDVKVAQPEDLQKEIDKYSSHCLMRFVEKQLPLQSPAFRALTQEYHDGILLFTLMEQNIWRKAIEDTNGLKAFYMMHKADFETIATLKVISYKSADSVSLSKFMQLRDRKAEVNHFKDITAQPETIQPGHARYKNLLSVGIGNCLPIERSTPQVFTFMCLEEIVDNPDANFETMRSEVVKQYQQNLENEWMNELAKRYPVTIHPKVYSKLFN